MSSGMGVEPTNISSRVHFLLWDFMMSLSADKDAEILQRLDIWIPCWRYGQANLLIRTSIK